VIAVLAWCVLEGERLLGYYSVWPFFIEIGVVLAIAATPLFRAADSPPIPVSGRIENFDGLRGFLALSVFFHHTAVYHQYLAHWIWAFPPSRFYSLLGGAGVSMFFMITGYLFYSQVLKAKGRPDWKKLYVGRIFRILPLYWFSVALVLIGVGIHTGWHLNVPRHTLLLQIARWSAGGVFEESWINAYVNTSRITLFVTWTLRYEWFFYVSLLALAIPARRRWSGLLLPPVLLASVMIVGVIFSAKMERPLICVALFLVGMSTAALKTAKPQLRLHRNFTSVFVILLLVLTFVTCAEIYKPLPVLMLGAAFLLIGFGADLFGLLTSFPARRMGNISYGIYLLQGPVFAVFSANRSIRALDLWSPIGHFSVSLLEAIALVTLSTLTHRWIERPGIDLGRRLLSKRLPERPPASALHA
jgi:peptidoglycan/LPS O-acetylase OafA/YrhL